MAETRVFTEADRAPLRALFRRAGEGSPSSVLWGHEDSEAAIYLDAYMDHAPESLFVAVHDDALVGYLTGCVDTAAFPSEDKRISDAVRQYRLMWQRGTMAFFARATLDMGWAWLRRKSVAGELQDPRWPAHLHINVVPQVRGAGIAEALMKRWLGYLRDRDVAGCHLQTLVENPRAVRFFERMGFVRYGSTPLVPGVRYQGRKVHQQTMVWSSVV